MKKNFITLVHFYNFDIIIIILIKVNNLKLIIS